MIRVLKFRLSLLKERLSINSIKEKCLFTVIIVAIAVISKLLVCCVGNYNITVLMLSILFALVSSEIIFPKQIKERAFTVHLFFDTVDVQKYRHYLHYRGYVYYQLIFLYLLFPLESGGADAFLISFLLFQSYIFITVIVRSISTEKFFASYKWASSFLICAFYFINSRYDYIDMKSITFETNTRIILFSAAAAQAIISSQNLEKRSHANIKHIFFRGLYIENKDILFVMRSDALLRPTIVTMFAGVVSYTLQESFEDMLFTNTISFFFMFSDIYTSLIKYENQSYGLLYSVAASRQFKLEKIKNTIIIVVPVLLVLSVPLSFITSFSTVVIAFLISISLFGIMAFCFKLTIEKKQGYQMVISERDEYRFLIVSIVLLCTIYSIPVCLSIM